ncbi:MAG: hypothetical protein HFF63_00315 [Oscillospiraceae bacterium]|nr:hypothetical protein [Oscillospiraceae bacterium]
MKNRAWLRRPFDPRLQYAFLAAFSGLLCAMLSERIVQLPPLPDRWQIPARLLLAAALTALLLWCACRGRDRRHTLARGWGWWIAGMILGNLATALLGRDDSRENNSHLFWLAGILAVLLAAGLYVEWRERDVPEE